MGRSIQKRLRALDTFGEPVGVNFKGESNYRTILGAICTIGIQSFLLVYTTQQMFNLFNYAEPTIIQVGG